MLIQKACRQDYKRIYQLYCLSFPWTERKPFSRICRNCRKGKMEMWVIKEDTNFLGFFVCAVYEEMVLIDYFAVVPSKRGEGIGAKSLKLLSDIYPEHHLFLEIEPENDKASNAFQRVRRKNSICAVDFRKQVLCGICMAFLWKYCVIRSRLLCINARGCTAFCMDGSGFCQFVGFPVHILKVLT